ncbi:hypothetical protein PVOR_12655 [Paenibacillus vortex V453]|uniref:Uncharacterized protein n=1 Tax=Paenibacillus vortex V453 TaxID=715225 RepID=A0A2R9SWM0_9BACL|nr:hypothetical protein PVOR_12655 [Paenibacillus vortex V453]
MAPAPKVDRYTGEKSREIPYVYTDQKRIGTYFQWHG